MIDVLYKGNIGSTAYKGDAGYDLIASSASTIAPGKINLIHTDLFVAIPEGYVGMVCSRSGLALKKMVFVLNAPGIIDSGYRGEIGVILCNLSDTYFDVAVGDRVAQLLILPVESVNWQLSKLASSERGEGGFGSSGVKS